MYQVLLEETSEFDDEWQVALIKDEELINISQSNLDSSERKRESKCGCECDLYKSMLKINGLGLNV